MFDAVQIEFVVAIGCCAFFSMFGQSWSDRPGRSCPSVLVRSTSPRSDRVCQTSRTLSALAFIATHGLPARRAQAFQLSQQHPEYSAQIYLPWASPPTRRERGASVCSNMRGGLQRALAGRARDCTWVGSSGGSALEGLRRSAYWGARAILA